MKGYKGMTKEMTCRGMPFEIGKSYHVEGNVKVCHKGLHFCEKLTDVFEFYHPDESRFFEIVADGDISTDGRKSAASDMTIVRELTAKEINRARYGNGNGDGDGDGNGYGYGNGYGNGDGYGYGNGDGYGDGDDYGNGDGDGYGDGYGNGDGYGYGNGDGDGRNIQSILTFNI